MANPKPTPSPGHKADKVWRDALKLAVNRVDDVDGKKVKRLARIAEATVKEAMKGDMAAIKEIGDRLDGKPQQSIDNTHEVGNELAQLLAAFDRKGREERS